MVLTDCLGVLYIAPPRPFGGAIYIWGVRKFGDTPKPPAGTLPLHPLMGVRIELGDTPTPPAERPGPPSPFLSINDLRETPGRPRCGPGGFGCGGRGRPRGRGPA